ncbi:MAG: hypothetical protein H0W69_01290 [Gemmatimonadaceae bacterium]|nr:hypothetical protein [Gemmatimonadaceae bacterium]
MTPHDKFSNSVSTSAKAGSFNRDQLVLDACELSRDLRDKGSTPEAMLIVVKRILEGAAVRAPLKMQEDIVTNCIETFFEAFAIPAPLT